MDYSTSWSILDTPAKTIQSNIVSLWISIGAALLWILAKKFKRDAGDGDRAVILWGTGAFSILGLAGYLLLTFVAPDKTNERTLEMLNSTTSRRVEGVVSNFERTIRHSKYGSVTAEKFNVDTVQFAYGDDPISTFGSFCQTYNDVIFNGQRVRITYTSCSLYQGNCILKLEIAK